MEKRKDRDLKGFLAKAIPPGKTFEVFRKENLMNNSYMRLQRIAGQLPPQHLEEVIDFAEFLIAKTQNEPVAAVKKRLRPGRLKLPTVKGITFIGDPLIRREELYSDLGR